MSETRGKTDTLSRRAVPRTCAKRSRLRCGTATRKTALTVTSYAQPGFDTVLGVTAIIMSSSNFFSFVLRRI